jgi:hypothetical protein
MLLVTTSSETSDILLVEFQLRLLEKRVYDDDWFFKKFPIMIG